MLVEQFDSFNIPHMNMRYAWYLSSKITARGLPSPAVQACWQTVLLTLRTLQAANLGRCCCDFGSADAASDQPFHAQLVRCPCVLLCSHLDAGRSSVHAD